MVKKQAMVKSQAVVNNQHINPSGRNPSGAAAMKSSSAKPSSGGRIHRQWQPVVQKGVQAAEAMAPVLSEFWGIPLHTKLFSVSTESAYFTHADDFYVSQLALSEQPGDVAQLRISDLACDGLLNTALGTQQVVSPENLEPLDKPIFRFQQLTGFESHLLTQVSKDLFRSLQRTLIHKSKENQEAHRAPSRFLHFVWIVYSDDIQGKIMLSLPISAVKLPAGTTRSQNTGLFDTDLPAEHWVERHQFFHAHSEVSLFIGKSQVELSELRQLEVGDVVILNHSHSEQLALVEPDSQIQFPFTVHLLDRYRYELPYEAPYIQEMATMNDTHNNELQHTQTSHTMGKAPRDALWNHLMIDVQAEFLPMRLPLSQIRQMSEGMIVELSDLSDNEIRLHVEDKTLAHGELVIVGDKFGLRITRLEATADAQDSSEAISSTEEMHYPAIAGETPTTEHFTPGEELQPAPQTEPQQELDDFLNTDFDADPFADDEDW
ncbi:MAG: FliM/FliN family flagellar motor switch protein [Cyanobacteria bacterium]|nr:FliM/FliN family flagellar motor switch protein [Cyanobacteriota bacterium]